MRESSFFRFFGGGVEEGSALSSNVSEHAHHLSQRPVSDESARYEVSTNLSISLSERLLFEFDAVLECPRLDETGSLSELSSTGKSREEVMGDLHLKASVNEIEPLQNGQTRLSVAEQRTDLRTVDIHRRSQLSMHETLVDAHILVVLSRMREDDLSRTREEMHNDEWKGAATYLDVDRTDSHENDEREHESSDPDRVGRIGSRHVFEERSVVRPEEGDSDHLVRSEPVRLRFRQQLRHLSSVSKIELIK